MFNLFQSLTPINYLKYETLLELISEFSTAVEYKISLHKSVVSNKKVSEIEIRKTIPFAVASKK